MKMHSSDIAPDNMDRLHSYLYLLTQCHELFEKVWNKRTIDLLIFHLQWYENELLIS